MHRAVIENRSNGETNRMKRRKRRLVWCARIALAVVVPVLVATLWTAQQLLGTALLVVVLLFTAVLYAIEVAFNRRS